MELALGQHHGAAERVEVEPDHRDDLRVDHPHAALVDDRSPLLALEMPLEGGGLVGAGPPQPARDPVASLVVDRRTRS